jgi:hypothetical protein
MKRSLFNKTKCKKEADRTVRCASLIFKLIAYKLSFTNRKRKYFKKKTTATSKIKQTSIATVRNHILTGDCFPTMLFLFIYKIKINISVPY